MSSNSSQQVGQTVGARLRAARLAKKYTQNQLARPDFSVSYISAIERGQIQPSLRALEILAQRLELNATDLLPAHGPLVVEPAPAAGQVEVADEEQELLLLEAQIAIHQGNSEQAIEILRPQLSQKGEQRWESAVRYILGWAYLESGHLQESEQLLAEVARKTREAADPYYPSILSLQSTVYTAMRNTEQALQVQRESLSYLERRSASTNVFFLAQLYTGLARYYSSLNKFEQATEMLKQALAALQTQASHQQLQAYYQDLLQRYKEEQEYQLASLYGYKWLQAAFQASEPGLKSEIQYALERALLKSNPDEAYAYLLGVSQENSIRPDPLSLAGANVHLAAWFAARGDFEKAEFHVNEAQKQADLLEDTIIGADTLLLKGELAYKRQDFVVGDQCFEAGLVLLERLGEKEDLIEHLAHYARLLEERNLIHKSIIYWKRAYESRQKNRTTPL